MKAEIWVKGALCLVAAFLVSWDRRRAARASGPAAAGGAARRARPWLVGAGLVAVVAYYNAGEFHFSGFIHHWEQFHYQLGSKYFPELGYDGLYAASVYHQATSRPDHPIQPWVRDLRTNGMAAARDVFAQGEEVKRRFSAERWRQFVVDHGYYLDAIHPAVLRAVRRDHGYNPTPTWTFVARLFAGGPVDGGALVRAGLLDPLLLLVLFVSIFRTYGSRVGSLCLLVFGLGYAWRFHWIGGAFLRLDWLAAVGIAVCAMRAGRCRWAGALLAYAGMVRIFPFAFLFGPAIGALRALVKKEDLAWAGRLGQGFVLGLVLCLAAGALTGRGFGAWVEFAQNLDKHRGTWLTNNVGLANTVLYDLDVMRRVEVNWGLPEPWLPVQQKIDRLTGERRPWIAALTGVYLVLFSLACWRARREESVVLGIVAIFALTLLTCYYWIMLLLVPLRSATLGTVALLLLSAGLYGLHLLTPAFEMIYGLMSWALALLFLAWMTRPFDGAR